MKTPDDQVEEAAAMLRRLSDKEVELGLRAVLEALESEEPLSTEHRETLSIIGILDSPPNLPLVEEVVNAVAERCRRAPFPAAAAADFLGTPEMVCGVNLSPRGLWDPVLELMDQTAFAALAEDLLKQTHALGAEKN